MLNRKVLITILSFVCLPIAVLASTGEQLEKVAADGNVALVLVMEPGAAGLDQARRTIEDAAKQIPGSVVIESNRADATNSAFVQKYGLAAAPVPLFLVFAPNGAIAGGNVASRLQAQQLAALVPSPRKAEVLKALQSGHAVYVTASRAGMASTSALARECATACTQMQGKCVSVAVDMDDPLEKGFLNQLKVNTRTTEPVTVVINAKGQVTGNYRGVVEAEKLIASATKVVAGGCCPSGSGKTCGPAPAKKGK